MYFGNELYHHGRLNQRWGVRNGPPYPLSRSTVREAYGSKRKAKKQEKIEREAAAKREAEEKEKARKAADKDRVLREGSATEVLQYKNELTPQQLNEALQRIRYINQLTEISKSEVEKGWKAIDDVMKKVGNVKDWTKTGVELWKNIDEALKLIEKNSK